MLEYRVGAKRIDSHGSVASTKDAEITLDTGMSGRIFGRPRRAFDECSTPAVPDGSPFTLLGYRAGSQPFAM